ncbi:MAG: HNH endonuclease [Paenibacillaceae bacterium]
MKNLKLVTYNHIQPHAENGLDGLANMLMLCPNHHIMFDLGIISIEPNDHSLRMISHVDKTDILNESKLKLNFHELSMENVLFHYQNIHLPLKDYFDSLK